MYSMPDTFAFTTIRIYKVLFYIWIKNVYVLTFIGVEVCYGDIYQFDVINSMSMLPFGI